MKADGRNERAFYLVSGLEMREPVAVSKRTSRVVPSGKVCPRRGKENGISMKEASSETLRANWYPEWFAIITSLL